MSTVRSSVPFARNVVDAVAEGDGLAKSDEGVGTQMTARRGTKRAPRVMREQERR